MKKKITNRWCNRYTDVMRRMRRNILFLSTAMWLSTCHHIARHRSDVACIAYMQCQTITLKSARTHTHAHSLSRSVPQSNCQQQTAAAATAERQRPGSDWSMLHQQLIANVCPTTTYLNTSYEIQYRFIHTTDQIDPCRQIVSVLYVCHFKHTHTSFVCLLFNLIRN